MPTVTFNKLSEDKKRRIITAAKEEFTKKSINEVSIKSIVEKANIARGSFYQYFDSKEELLSCIIEQDWQIKKFIELELNKTKIDIFEFYINSYDYLSNKIKENNNIAFYKKVFENIKVSDTTYEFFCHGKKKIDETFNKTDFLKKIDTRNLKIKNEQELKSLIKMLFLITRGAFAFNVMKANSKSARDEYIRNINMLKYGVSKKKEEIK